jgi:hypothetical protein
MAEHERDGINEAFLGGGCDRSRPSRSQGVALTSWSTESSLVICFEQQITQLSPTALRSLPDAAGLSFQRVRSWKMEP